MLRSVLVAGATAVIQQAKNGRGRPSPWLLALLARKSSRKLAADGARQQDCPHRLEADGDGRELSMQAASRSHRRTPPNRDRSGGAFGIATSTGAGAARGTDGRIDRSEVRDTPWDPLARKGRWRVWNSRRGEPSWPAVTNRINRPDIWMQAIRSDLEKLLRHGGRPHMGPRFRGDDAPKIQISNSSIALKHSFAISPHVSREVC